nr:hypothetical protein [Bacteroidales bacterium]
EQRLSSPAFLGSAERGYAPLACSLLFNTAPFMLYFGQEVGEDGRDGAAGRTSIFNWCNPPQLRKLWQSLYEQKPLKRPEASLLARYRDMLACAKRPAFAEGGTWDLGYCNGDAPGFDPGRHFAFVRYDAHEAWLVVCNFSDTPARVQLTLPPELRAVRPGLPAAKAASVRPFDAAILPLVRG